MSRRDSRGKFILPPYAEHMDIMFGPFRRPIWDTARDVGRNVVVPSSLATEFVHSEMIEIRVGKPPVNQKTFHAHRNILTSQSPFFAAALTQPWAEARDKAVCMPEDDPEAFALWLQYVYTGKLGIKDNRDEYTLLMSFYVMAEKLLDAHTKDVCVGVVLERMRTKDCIGGKNYFPGPQPIRVLYAGTCEGSAMRRLMIDAYAEHATHEFLEGAREELPKEFLFELAVALVKMSPDRDRGLSGYQSVLACSKERYMENGRVARAANKGYMGEKVNESGSPDPFGDEDWFMKALREASNNVSPRSSSLE